MIIQDKLEANICRHCNNRCAACNHGSAFVEPYFMEPEILRRDLAMLSRILHVGFFCLQGGEPLLHPKIIELMDISMNSGIADKYGILSNGKLLSRMPDEFFVKAGEMKCELRVTVYPNFDVKELEPSLAKAKLYGFEIRPGGIGSFLKIFKEQPDCGKVVWEICPWKTCYTVHEGHFFHCPLAAFFPEQFFGMEANIDGICMDGLTEQGLADFLARTEPLKTCAHCSGASGGRIDWHEVKTFEEWKEKSTE